MTIQKYIKEKLDTGEYERNFELGAELGISSAMLSHYNQGRTRIPSLDVAKTVYKNDGIVIWPYAEVAVSGEENGR